MATLTSISIAPSNPFSLISSTVSFTATAHFSDTTTSSITTDAVWTSSDTAVATISNTAGTIGRATTQTISGSTTITATYGGKAGTTVLRVGLANYIRIVEPTVDATSAHNPIQKFSVPNTSMFTGGVVFVNTTNVSTQIGYTTVSGHPGDFCKLYNTNQELSDGYWVQLNVSGLATTTFGGTQRNLGVVSSTPLNVNGIQIGTGFKAPILVQIAGEAYVFATSPIASGDFLGPDTNGKIKTITFDPENPTPILGFALESYGTTYDGMVLMRIQICGE